MRLTAITDVRRRDNGLRVSGVIDSRFGHPPYDDAGGYEHNGYAPPGDLTFRCNVDYSGIVHNPKGSPRQSISRLTPRMASNR